VPIAQTQLSSIGREKSQDYVQRRSGAPSLATGCHCNVSVGDDGPAQDGPARRRNALHRTANH